MRTSAVAATIVASFILSSAPAIARRALQGHPEAELERCILGGKAEVSCFKGAVKGDQYAKQLTELASCVGENEANKNSFGACVRAVSKRHKLRELMYTITPFATLIVCGTEIKRLCSHVESITKQKECLSRREAELKGPCAWSRGDADEYVMTYNGVRITPGNQAEAKEKMLAAQRQNVAKKRAEILAKLKAGLSVEDLERLPVELRKHATAQRLFAHGCRVTATDLSCTHMITNCTLVPDDLRGVGSMQTLRTVQFAMPISKTAVKELSHLKNLKELSWYESSPMNPGESDRSELRHLPRLEKLLLRLSFGDRIDLAKLPAAESVDLSFTEVPSGLFFNTAPTWKSVRLSGSLCSIGQALASFPGVEKLFLQCQCERGDSSHAKFERLREFSSSNSCALGKELPGFVASAPNLSMLQLSEPKFRLSDALSVAGTLEFLTAAGELFEVEAEHVPKFKRLKTVRSNAELSVDSILALAALPAVEDLELNGYRITSEDLSALKSAPFSKTLKSLDLGYVGISEAEAAGLAEALKRRGIESDIR